MAYKDFTLDTIEEKFGVKNSRKKLFGELKPLQMSEWLTLSLEAAATLPVRSEKAKSEAFVYPLLVEMRNLNDNFFTFYSGENLIADPKNGLKGECDFILTVDTGSFSISYPILQIVEAKKNDMDLGIPQCAAQLIGARLFNQKKGVDLPRLYGCVTTGSEWLFMALEHEIMIDTRSYYLTEFGHILAVFQNIIDYFKTSLVHQLETELAPA